MKRTFLFYPRMLGILFLGKSLAQSLDGRSIDELNPDELYALAKVLPDFSQDYRLEVYKGVLRDAFEQRSVKPTASLKVFQPIRRNLQIAEELHWLILEHLQIEAPSLFDWARGDTTVVRSTFSTQETTVYQPIDLDATQVVRKVDRSTDSPDDATVKRDP